MNDVVRESPNFYRDRLGVAITGVTLHSTRGGERTRGDPEAEFSAALDWLTRRSYQTAEGATYRNPSIHYIVRHDGRLARVVPERHGAWHAGTGADRRGANLNAIGVELVQPTADTPYPEALIARAVALVADVCHRHGIPARRTHDDAEPGIHHHSDLTSRKSDPGALWPSEVFIARVAARLRALRGEGAPDDAAESAALWAAVEGNARAVGELQSGVAALRGRLRSAGAALSG